MQPPISATESPAVPWLRRFLRPKFSLRTLLLGMALLGGGLGIFQRLDQTRQLVARIEAAGGICDYRKRESSGGFETWLRTWLPRSYFEDINFVGVSADTENVDWIVAHLGGLRSLDCLVLQGTQVSDAGLSHLPGMKSLNTIGLENTQVSNAGLSHLVGLKSLEFLDLDNTQVSNAGLAHLAGLKSLRVLQLANTQISDAGLSHLVGLKSLESIRLANTQVSDAGLSHLAGLKSLEYLDLDGTQVSDAGIQQLRISLPSCRIVRD